MQTTIGHFAQHKTLLPLLEIYRADDIIPIINALLAANIHALEITLRTPAAFEAIGLARQKFPTYGIIAGTVTTAKQLQQVQAYNVDFAVCPGITPSLLDASRKHHIELLPGIATASEVLLGVEHSLQYFKFFPAEAMGGVNTLQAFAGPFQQVHFLATGGINQCNMESYLALDNCFAVGGSWIINQHDINNKNWHAITTKAQQAMQTILLHNNQ